MQEQHLTTVEIQIDSLENKAENGRRRRSTRAFGEDAKGPKIRSNSCRRQSLRIPTQRSISRRSARNARTPSPMLRNSRRGNGDRPRTSSRSPGGVIPRAERFVEVERTTPAPGPQTYRAENSLDRLRKSGTGGIIPKAHRFVEERGGRSTPGPQSYRAEDALDRMLKAPEGGVMSKASRFEVETRKQTPGPLKYCTARAYLKSARSSRSTSISFSRAKKDAPIFLFNKVYAS